MEKITERELVERFGTEIQMRQYEEQGKLVGYLKKRVLDRAKHCCTVTPLEHKMYKLTAIKSERYVNNAVRSHNDVYKDILPVVMSVFCTENSVNDWRAIAIKANLVDKRLFVWSRNSIVVSEISGKSVDEVYTYFGKMREFIKYYVDKSIEYLLKGNFISCVKDDGIERIVVNSNPYEKANLRKCRNNAIKAISQKVYDSTLKDWKLYTDILFNKMLGKKSVLIKKQIDNLLPVDLFDEDALFYSLSDRSEKTNLQINRNTPEYFEWKESVLKRDNYTCQCCGFKENLQAHHIENYADNVDLRTDVSNGITLCEGCHAIYSMGSFHNIFGTRHNTRKQLELYLNKYGKIRKVIQDILFEDE